MNACNTFEAPDTLMPRDLAVSVNNGEVVLTLPPLSVTSLSGNIVKD
jgi:hypothetical protein